MIIARDITERHHQEAERERLLRTEQAARRASEAAHARVRLLADGSALLERSMSDAESLQDVAELLVAQLSDAAMIDVLGRDTRIRRLGAASRGPGGDRLLARLAVGNRLQPAADHPIPRAMNAQQAAFLDDPAERYIRDVARTDREAERFREAAGRSLAVVPLVARGRSVGVLTVGWQKPGRTTSPRRASTARSPRRRSRARSSRCSPRAPRRSRAARSRSPRSGRAGHCPTMSRCSSCA